MNRSHGTPLPHQIFRVTPEERSALARERFFTTGERPSGLVSEEVIQSWYRCVTSGRSAQERLSIDTVSKLRASTALRTSRELRETSAPGLNRLEAAIAGTPCQVILTNADGTVVYASRRASSHEELVMKQLARVGVDLSEHSLGTNAPGIVVKTGQACAVLRGEHFNDAIAHVQCAAAPIRDIDARLAGVLNISIEGRPFGFDALGLIGAYAAVIEDRLVAWQARDKLVLALQTDFRLLDSHQAGLMVLDEGGRLVWLNDAAARLTQAAAGDLLENAIGIRVDLLLGHARAGQPQRLRISNGLHLWLRVHLHEAERATSQQGSVSWGAAASTPSPTEPLSRVLRQWKPSEQNLDNEANPEDLTLRNGQREKVARALEASGGNVSRAARMLGVSRGLIYRHQRAGDT